MQLLIVDDDHLVTSSLKMILGANQEVTVVGVGNSADDAVCLYEEKQPDILLMDIRMGEKTGLDAAREIFKKYPDAAILFLTTFSDDDYIIEALRLGAKGYLLKQNFDAILPALKAILNGQKVFGSAIIDKLPSLLQQNASTENVWESYHLTDREMNILTCVADGLNNKEIAETLFLSEGTIRNYISVLLEKLQVRDRTQLAIFYYRNLP